MNTHTDPARAAKRRLPIILSATALAVACCVVALSLGAAEPAEGAFPGNNGKIVFAGYSNGDYNIWVMNADGSYRTYLTSSPDWELDPAFSPDGSKIAYTRGETTDKNDIWVMNAFGGGQTNLTPGPGIDNDAAWSPDGSKIAFESWRSGDTDIYVMNADGSGQTNLTNHPGSDTSPAWSPDGSKIAFVTSRDNATLSSEIYVMNADGSGQTGLTKSPRIDVDPEWSPDGTKIAYGTLHPWHIYVMNADGSDQTNLTSSGHDSYPSWSPDGSKIAFTSWRDGNGEIYIMNADGSAQNNVTQLVDEDYGPSWETVPSADLALSLVANPSEAKAQKPLTYTIRVDNIGPSNGAGAVVTDDLPAEQRFVSASPSQGSCQTPPVGTNGTVTCNLGFLLRNHSATVEVVVKVLAPRKSSVSNTATVAGGTADPNTANNAATIATPVK